VVLEQLYRHAPRQFDLLVVVRLGDRHDHVTTRSTIRSAWHVSLV
jgi:hypothetical protein